MVEIIRYCKICGKQFIAHSSHEMYCDNCKGKSKKDYNRTPNAICEYCGKLFYRHPSQKSKIRCCSHECNYRLRHKEGKTVYWKSYANEHGIINFPKWLQNEHFVKGKTLKQISLETGIRRATITELLDNAGYGHRNIANDNLRRYSTMTPEQIRQQAKPAFKKAKLLWDNDKQWSENHIRKIMEARDFMESSIEIKVQNLLNEMNIKYNTHYQEYRYFIDIALVEYKIAIECDGDYWHSLPKQVIADKKRDEFLNKNGWQVLRLKEHEINTDIDSCKQKILDKINKK